MAIPAVQTGIAKYFTNQINEETGVNLQIDKIQITVSGKIIVKDFIAFDDHQDTIFYGKRLETRILNPWNITKNNRLLLDNTHIEQLLGKIIYYKGEKQSNLDKFIDRIDGEPSGQPNKNPFVLKARKIGLTNSHFRYLDFNNKDPRVLDFQHLHANLNQFLVKGDLISFDAKRLQMLDYRGLQIQDLSTKFKYDSKEIRLDKLHLETDYSNIDMDLLFQSPGKGYPDFNNKVKISGKITEAYLSTNDLLKFSKVFAPEHQISISTNLSGTLNRLVLNNFDAVTDNRINLEGDLILSQIFKANNYVIQSNLKQLNFSFDRLAQLFPKLINDNIPENVRSLGNTNLSGKLNYGKNQLVSDITAQTDLGALIVKLKMHNLAHIASTTYEGHIEAENFKLKELLKEDVDNITTSFDVKGTGLTLPSLNANFIGQIAKLDYNKYTYHDISVNGYFKKKLFQGQFDVADKNLEMDFSGLIDFSQKKRKLDFSAEICKANLYALNFSKDEFSHLEGEINLQATGTNIDDIVGKLLVNRLKITNQYDTYLFDDLLITSNFTGKERDIELKSTDIIDGYIKGVYTFDKIPLLLKNAFGSVFANYEIKPIEQEQYINYKFTIHNKIVDLFNPKLKIAKNTYIKGKLNSDNNLLKMKVVSPKISYDKKDFVAVNLRIDNKNPLYNIFLKVDTINAGFYQFKHLRLLNTTINDTLYLKTKFEGGKKYDDKYDISFYYTMDELQNFIFGLQKSSLQFKDIPWVINPQLNANKIFYSPKKDSLQVKDVGIIHEEERISLFGYKTKENLDFKVALDSIRLSHITPELEDFEFDGQINGQIHVAKYKEEILPSANLQIKHFKLNKTLLGDVNLKVNTLPGNNVFVDLSILKEQLQTLKLIGYVDLNKKTPIINASLLLNEFPVKPLAKLFKDIFGNIRGKLSGNVQIKGPIDNLSYDGKLYLNFFGLKILALNTDYEFENRTVVYLHDQTFELKDAVFYDTEHHTKGKISGVIKHHNFGNWYLDLNIKTDNLLVLNTPPDPQELFYGKVFVKGTTRIYGYTDRLKIDANMQTKPNTRFVITLTDAETLGEDDFVRIISKQAYKKEKKNLKRKFKVYEGLEMNFDLDITPDAEVEILLDQEFGSTLVAKGSGAMYMEVNTNGRFNIWGDFTVLDGIYNFKYGGVIDKKFKVDPGSYISWEGDPYNANLDIKAVYETFADPSILLANQGVTSKKMPVDVIIYLKDKLMHPTISFDLELPKANAILKSQVDYALSDPDKKTLQALSLLSFGNFINEDDYNFSKQATEGAVRTISETGLNILNALMGQDENFQVNLNYSGGENDIDKNIVTDPQVGLSLVTKINKRVYINGKVAVPVGRYTKSSIVGDVELEVYLDDKGNLVFRVFNKQTELEYIGQQEGYTQGIGISYQVDFDTFKEILQKIGISVKTD